jgi:L-arabinonolactonase
MGQLRIRRLGDFRCQVGEGPLWDERAQRLYFVDLVGQRLCRFNPVDERFEQWDMPETIAALALTESGGIVVALADAFYSFNPATQALVLLARAPLPQGAQFNDGKVDRGGRFVGVSMERTMKAPLGGIYRLGDLGDPGGPGGPGGPGAGRVETLADGYVIGNGPCWSLDGRTFYCSDSIPRTIYAYDYGAGALSNRRVFAETGALGGIPDGATIDASGQMWMAICGAGKIAAFAADGGVARVIDMPTRWVSSVMFGGPGLDRLYVPSLDPTLVGLPPDEHAGYLYVIEDLDAHGVAEPRLRLEGKHQEGAT